MLELQGNKIYESDYEIVGMDSKALVGRGSGDQWEPIWFHAGKIHNGTNICPCFMGKKLEVMGKTLN